LVRDADARVLHFDVAGEKHGAKLAALGQLAFLAQLIDNHLPLGIAWEPVLGHDEDALIAVVGHEVFIELARHEIAFGGVAGGVHF
jgi:hypothetical protein